MYSKRMRIPGITNQTRKSVVALATALEQKHGKGVTVEEIVSRMFVPTGSGPEGERRRRRQSQVVGLVLKAEGWRLYRPRTKGGSQGRKYLPPGHRLRADTPIAAENGGAATVQGDRPYAALEMIILVIPEDPAAVEYRVYGVTADGQEILVASFDRTGAPK